MEYLFFYRRDGTLIVRGARIYEEIEIFSVKPTTSKETFLADSQLIDFAERSIVPREINGNVVEEKREGIATTKKRKTIVFSPGHLSIDRGILSIDKTLT